MTTYICERIGQRKSFAMNPFADAQIKLDNPYKMLNAETFQKLQIFWSKKDAVEFCRRWKYPKRLVVRVHSRWQFGYAIHLGHFWFAPAHAEARLIAQCAGYVINKIE